MNDWDPQEVYKPRKQAKHLLMAAFLLLPILLPIVWSIYSWKTDDNEGTWFARSGSILVLGAVFAEYGLSIMLQLYEKAQGRRSWKGDYEVAASICHPVRWAFNMFHIIAISQAIVGTFIWGYGDTLWEWLK